MEITDWNFEPAIYYGWLHNKYSGAKNKFLGLDYSFHENKSDIKRAIWSRSANATFEGLRRQYMYTELDSLKPVVDEETYLAIDRNIDIHYNNYKDNFESLQNAISKMLSYSLKRSKGYFQEEVFKLSMRNEAVCDAIAILRKTGPGHEMSNSDRQEGYENALKEMKVIYEQSCYLVRSTIFLYPK